MDACLRRLTEQRIPIALIPGGPRLDLPLLRPNQLQDVGLLRRRLLSDAASRAAGHVPLRHPLGLIGRNVGSLQPHRLALARRHKEHVAVPQQRLGAVLVQDGPAVDLGRYPERDPAGKVRLDESGDHIYRGPLGSQNQVDADGPRLLRQDRERGFHLGLYRHHQVGQLIDDHDDEWQDPLAIDLIDRRLRRRVRGFRIDRCKRRLGPGRGSERLSFFDLAVEIGNVPRTVGLEQLVAALHLEDRPLEHRGSVVIVGDHLVPHMGKCVVHRELHHLRIDHQKAELFLCIPINQTGDDGVDGDRLAGAGCPRDQQMGHLREVRDDRLALEIVSQSNGQDRAASFPVGGLEQLTQGHDPGDWIGNLHPDRTLARYGCHPDRGDSHGNGEIVGQRADPARLDARSWDDLELSDNRAGRPRTSPPFHLECPQRLDERQSQLVQLGLAGVDVLL